MRPVLIVLMVIATGSQADAYNVTNSAFCQQAFSASQSRLRSALADIQRIDNESSLSPADCQSLHADLKTTEHARDVYSVCLEGQERETTLDHAYQAINLLQQKLEVCSPP